MFVRNGLDMDELKAQRYHECVCPSLVSLMVENSIVMMEWESTIDGGELNRDDGMGG